jgi:hypothetical protein
MPDDFNMFSINLVRFVFSFRNLDILFNNSVNNGLPSPSAPSQTIDLLKVFCEPTKVEV